MGRKKLPEEVKKIKFSISLDIELHKEIERLYKNRSKFIEDSIRKNLNNGK